MKTWLVQAIVKGVLAWLKGWLDTLYKIHKAREEGREEIASKTNEATEKLKKDAKEISKTNSSLDNNAVADRLRKRYEREVRNSASVR